MGLQGMLKLHKIGKLLEGPFLAYQIVFWLSVLTGGLYFPWQWGLVSLLYMGILAWQLVQSGRLRLPGGRVELACGGVILCFGIINVFIAADRGGGREGLLRLMVFLLFLLLILQWSANERKKILDALPFWGAVSVAVCGIGYWIPAVQPLLFENGRMAGPFQYANTYGLFLLLGFMRSLEHKRWQARILGGILLIGIAASGSRWTMVLLAGWAVWMAVRRKLDRTALVVLLLGGLTVLVLAAAFGGWTLSRFVDQRSFSTIWGRLLYLRDAFSLLADNPAGVGYLGWFYLQSGIQTGVYNVRFVHNEWVQMALDYGIPAAAAAGVLVFRRLKKGCLAPGLAVIICLHSMADPDLQFYGILSILALALSPAGECQYTISASYGRSFAVSAAAVTAVLSVCRGVADFALQTGHPETACRLAPYDTEAAVERMLERDFLPQASEDAYRILSHNTCLSIAWQIAAENALDQGAYERMAAAQQEAVRTRKYDQAVYDDALNRLMQAMDAGWPAEYAVEEMVWLMDFMDEVLAQTSSLGWKISDQPELSFPPETRMQIRVLQQSVEHSKEG